jgi:hypothetical protein
MYNIKTMKTMKKIYQTPTMRISSMEAMQMIATSDFGEGTKPGGEACARGFEGGWEDFDDEE